MDNLKEQETTNDTKDRKSPDPSTESPSPSPSTLSQNIELSTNDDDSITTSTESSDTFEAWTLVMDKQKLRNENRIEIIKDTNERNVEDEPEEDDEEEEEYTPDETSLSKDKELNDSSNDVTTDDLSDGISIISESESNGRVSPHPYLRDHLQDLNLKFVTAQHEDEEILYKLNCETKVERPYPTPVIVPENQQHQPRHRKSRRSLNTSEENSHNALQEATQTVMQINPMPPLLKRGLQGIFYIGVALSILALIGKIRNPTWQPLADSNNPSQADLEKKVNDMELQNNLMRAEIDLLNKQVKYLNNLNDPQQARKTGKYKGQYENEKTFKAWPGIGDSLRPVQITKKDLRRPFKCPDGTFTEFAGMCVEKQTNEPNIVEQFEQIVDDFKQQSETIQTFEQVAQELHGFTESPLEKVQQFLKGNEDQQHMGDVPEDAATKINRERGGRNEYIRNEPIYEPQYEKTEFQQMPPYEQKDYRKCEVNGDTKCFEKEYKKDHKKPYDSQLNQKFDKYKHQKNEKSFKTENRGHLDDSNERFNKRHSSDSKERYQKRHDESKERFINKRDDDSHERFHKRDADDSKDRFQKRSKEYSSKERGQRQKPNDSGEWQEKYMKHRENARKENEKKYDGDNKNWFFKRGDSRENKRNIDDVRSR